MRHSLKKIKKKISLIVYIVMVFYLMTGCLPIKYKGEYPDLYTAAINSLLGVEGYHSHGDSIIEILEEDKHGRIMYIYSEGDIFESYSLFICQKTEESNVYYYPDFNFISKEWAGENIAFSTDEIEGLKEKNDWNKEIDEDKCVKSEIVREKVKPKIQDEIDFEYFCKKIAVSKNIEEENTRLGNALYCTSDEQGRSMFFVWGRSNDYTDIRFYVVVIVNPDGTYNEDTCYMELTEYFNYQEELKAFKDLNNWNHPID